MDGRTARAAVLRLGKLFADLPRAIAKALDGARSSGELLSSDRLQGLAEILQNADDANAAEVRLVLRENDLLMGHDGDPVRLRHVLGLATPWLSTKGDEAESFGRFGIGLSALRSLSRTIEVHCSPYHVRLGIRRCRRSRRRIFQMHSTGKDGPFFEFRSTRAALD